MVVVMVKRKFVFSGFCFFSGNDGDLNTNNVVCTHTNEEYRPWWLVDLSDTVLVTHVIVTNRGDGACEYFFSPSQCRSSFIFASLYYTLPCSIFTQLNYCRKLLLLSGMNLIQLIQLRLTRPALISASVIRVSIEYMSD